MTRYSYPHLGCLTDGFCCCFFIFSRPTTNGQRPTTNSQRPTANG